MTVFYDPSTSTSLSDPPLDVQAQLTAAEIDALKVEKLHLRTTLDEAFRISDTHIAEIHALRADWDAVKTENYSLKFEVNVRDKDIEKLKAENERLRKDAGRYSWLRDPKTDVRLVIDKVVSEIPTSSNGGGGYRVYEYRAGEELDAAIDAAMSEFPDGCDHEGFPGGCERFGHTSETCPVLLPVRDDSLDLEKTPLEKAYEDYEGRVLSMGIAPTSKDYFRAGYVHGAYNTLKDQDRSEGK